MFNFSAWKISRLPADIFSHLFVEAHYQLSLRIYWLIFYTLLKSVCLLFSILQSRSCYSMIDAWGISFLLFQLFQVSFYNSQRMALNDIIEMRIIAERIRELVVGSIQLLPIIRPRQVEIMIQQIKHHISLNNPQFRNYTKYNILLCQILILKYLYIILNSDYTTEGSKIPFYFYGNCQDSLLNMTLFLAFLLVLENVTIYIFIMILIIILPAISIYYLTKKLINAIKKYQLQKKLLQFKTHNYQGKGDVRVNSDHECRICMSDYQVGEEITYLPCNKLHHFHSHCIRQWLQLSIECPLCRKKLINISVQEYQVLREGQQQQQNQLEHEVQV